MGHVARMGHINSYILVGKSEGKKPLGLIVDGRIILELI
jgi:hypothetical protein